MKHRFLILMALFLALLPSAAWARTYSAKFNNASAEEVVKALKQETGMEFVYSKDLLKFAHAPVSCDYTNLTLDQLLNRVISIKMSLGYEVLDNRVLIKAPDMSVDFIKGSISGTVFDKETGETLPGATVVIEGTTIATATDMDGKFTVQNVQALNPVLSVFYVGMKPASVKVTKENQNNIVFNLVPNATIMSEVVVTGYADVSREKMTGAATTISSNQLDERYSLNLLDNLEGRVAGLSTYGGKPIIRGMGTLHGSSDPLLVVDGLPIEGSIEDLNPADIKSVNVLKDAAAAAIYGARAANGIIVVTTKNARNKGKIDIDFSADMTWYENKNVDYHDNFYMTPAEQIEVEKKYYDWYWFVEDPIHNNYPSTNYAQFQQSLLRGTSSPSLVNYAYYQLVDGQITRDQLDSYLNKLAQNNYARDYADAIYRRQLIQQYNLAIRSSSDKSDNNVVVNFKHDNAGIINNKMDWLNISYKGTFRFASWVEATLAINSVYENTRSYGYDYNSSATDPFGFTSYQPFYNEDGSVRLQYPWYSGHEYYSVADGLYDLGVNVIEEMYNNTNTTRRNNTRYHGNLLFKIIPGLTANAQFIYETASTNSQIYANEESHAARTLRNAYSYLNAEGKIDYMTPRSGGFLQTDVTNSNAWTARGQVNYQKSFGKHDIAAIAGLEFRETLSKGTRALALGYDDQLQSSSTHTVDFGSLSQMTYSPYYMLADGGFPAMQFVFSPYLQDTMGIIQEVRHRYGSGYANATYTFDDRYNVFGSFRKDYADVFGLNSKFRGKPLWSVGVGWNIHNESFAHEWNTWLSFLKLRASYGVTGNIYQGATSVMTASSGSINSITNLPYGTVTSPANPDLKWEQNRTFNVGLDFSLLNFRLRGSIDFYNKDGRDIFNGMNLDPTTGFTSIVANVASIRNQGLEIALSYDWFRANARTDFQWSSNLTFTYNRNEVLDVENDVQSAYQLIDLPYKKGYPVNAIWSYRFAGISDEVGMEGQSLYYIENDGVSHYAQTHSPDILEFSGQTDPKYIVGFDNTLGWYGFQLNFVLAYYGGHKMRALPHTETFGVGSGVPLESYFLDAWTPENQTDIPGIGQYSSSAVSWEPTYANNAVHDASFLKLRTLTLSYTFPDKWLKPIRFSGLSLRFQVNNLGALWKANKLGVDPETLGIRNPASYTIGLNFNL